MQIDCSIAHPTVIFKRLVADYGGYDEDILYCEDVDLWLRWFNNGVRFSNLDVPLIKFRKDEYIRNINIINIF